MQRPGPCENLLLIAAAAWESSVMGCLDFDGPVASFGPTAFSEGRVWGSSRKRPVFTQNLSLFNAEQLWIYVHIASILPPQTPGCCNESTLLQVRSLSDVPAFFDAV